MSEKYVQEIDELIARIPEDIINFSLERKRGNVPTQAFSEFLTNREQGDWAEDLIFRAINEVENGIIAVKYGKSDKIVAGDPEFKEFYEKYQDELDSIGKRPDLIIFRKEDFDFPDLDISHLDDGELKKIVPKAVAGLEIRSSSFLVESYKEFFEQEHKKTKNKIGELTEELGKHSEYLTNSWRDWLRNGGNIFDMPRGTPRTNESIIKIIKELRGAANNLKKRDFLSFTPKVEDIYVIYRWIKNFGVPHYYVQVFFDQVYAIPFKDILKIISDPSNEGKIFFVEKNAKNQFKRTIHISIDKGILLAEKVDFPDYTSEYKKLGRGRLLFYVTFKGGKAYLDVGKFYKMISLSSEKGDLQ